MSINDQNPYAPPQAALERTNLKQDALTGFTKISVWWVILISLLTLGLYPMYWLYTRTELVNTKMTYNPISMQFVFIVLAVYVSALLANIGFALAGISEEPNILLILNILGWLNWILILVWEFTLRSRFNNLFTSEFDHQFHFAAAWTFLFSIFYFQYKINRIFDAAEN